jgi:hypothetical protein
MDSKDCHHRSISSVVSHPVSLKDWYDNLKKSVGSYDFRIKDLAREIYQKAIKTPKSRDITA